MAVLKKKMCMKYGYSYGISKILMDNLKFNLLMDHGMVIFLLFAPYLVCMLAAGYELSSFEDLRLFIPSCVVLADIQH